MQIEIIGGDEPEHNSFTATVWGDGATRAHTESAWEVDGDLHAIGMRALSRLLARCGAGEGYAVLQFHAA
jgi:hypothetical protein